MFTEDRSKFPILVDGKPEIDLDSEKYVKIWQGPQHPGVTGNMALELVLCGDEVVKCKTHVGYLHRGFEKIFEKRSFYQNFTLVCRLTVPEPAFNEYLYSAALEELSGIEVPEYARWARTLNLELMRLVSYLMWFGGQAGALGMGTVGQWMMAYRDYLTDFFEEITGGRIYHMYMIPGGVRRPFAGDFGKRLKDLLVDVEKVLKEAELVLFNNAVFKARMKGLGIITKEMVDKYGVVGPNARAAGFTRDLRKDSPYLIYDQLDFDVVTGTESCAYERAWVRYQEMHQSISLLRQIIDKMPKDGPFHTKVPNVLNWKIREGATYVKAECTRGEYGYFMVTDGSGHPRRVHVRGPSYTHAVALLEKLAINTNIADIGGLMVSLHTYPPEIER